MKMFFALQMYLFQLYVSCYLFEIMNTQVILDAYILLIFPWGHRSLVILNKKLMCYVIRLFLNVSLKIKLSNYYNRYITFI